MDASNKARAANMGGKNLGAKNLGAKNLGMVDPDKA
jgi:hypothetical protein